LVLVLLFAAAPARSEIFQCTANKAMPTYQNFPCEFDTLGVMTAGSASGAPKSNPSAPTAAGPKPMPSGANSIPRVGMTTGEVKAIWGEPRDTTKEEYARGDIETWTYADSRSIRFDLKGRVAEIKW
jgi:hypothetical protein